MKTIFILSFILTTMSCSTQTIDKDGGVIMTIQFEKNVQPTIADSITNILHKRFSDFGVENTKIRNVDNLVIIEIPNNKDTINLKDLVTIRGNLEVWETYDNREVYEYINNINKKIIELNIDNRFIPDSVISPSNTPFFYKLIPLIDKNNQLIGGPIVGFALKNDISLIDSVLSLKNITDEMPINLVLTWGHYSVYDFYPLIAIKKSNYKISPINEKMIEGASIEHLNNNEYQIKVSLKKDYYNIWSKLKDGNFAKSFALKIDNEVFSYPGHNIQNKKNKIILTGNFDLNRARAIASILNTRPLPAIPIINKIEILDK